MQKGWWEGNSRHHSTRHQPTAASSTLLVTATAQAVKHCVTVDEMPRVSIAVQAQLDSQTMLVEALDKELAYLRKQVRQPLL